MSSFRPCGAGLVLVAALLGLATQAAAGATLSGCTLSIDDKRFELKGKYQVVESFPDFKVQVVGSFAQVHVEKVTSFPDSCGKQKFQNHFSEDPSNA